MEEGNVIKEGSGDWLVEEREVGGVEMWETDGKEIKIF